MTDKDRTLDGPGTIRGGKPLSMPIWALIDENALVHRS